MTEYIVDMYSEAAGVKCEPVVRCRDCANYKPYKTHRHGTMNRCYDENGNTHKRDECDFCSRGARREP